MGHDDRHEALAKVMERNIEGLLARRREEARRQSLADRIAERVARFTGSMAFVAIHAVLFGGWALAQLGLVPGVPRFDPDFVKLATFASVEAIFLSTFVLITQNRMAADADRRADLDLQVSLLSEHEVTRLIRLVTAMAARMGVEESQSPDLPELQRDVDPQKVLDRIEHAEATSGEPH